MRILVDENMPERVVNLLRADGHDVQWGRESYQGTSDPNLLEIASLDQRTLVTYDLDFGELVHRYRMPAPYGVLSFRIHTDVPDYAKEDFIARSVTIQDSWPPGVWTIQIRHQT